MLFAFVLASALQLGAAAPAADTLSGTWRVTGDVVGNPINELCTLRQAGTKLTGSCKGADADAQAYDVTGEVANGQVTFSHGGDYQGQTITITYAAPLASATELKGTVDVQPFGVGGTFTAAPAPAPARP